MKTAFFGTPPIAVASLDALYEMSDVALVVTQPDRPSGRGLGVSSSAVKCRALELGLEVLQPKRVRTGSLDQALSERGIELAVVLAYGRILPEAVLNAPRLGCVNLHASLLPKYRGAAPINWALANGESSTGVSLMQMDAGLDTGPILAQHPLPIKAQWNAGDLAVALGQLAAAVVRERLPELARGELPALAQDESLATYAPPLSARDAELDFSLTARQLHNRVRGFNPKPGTYTYVGGKRLKVLQTGLPEGEFPAAEPGTIVALDRRILVATSAGYLEVLRAQVEGRKAQDATTLLNGRVLSNGQRLGKATP